MELCLFVEYIVFWVGNYHANQDYSQFIMCE